MTFWRDVRGSAALEFVSGALVLLVPCVYAVVSFGAIESATFAVEGAARHSARLFVDQPDPNSARRVAEQSANDTLRAYSSSLRSPRVSVRCRVRCQGAGGYVTVRVTARVPLPLLPQWPAVRHFTSVMLSAESTQSTARFGVVP